MKSLGKHILVELFECSAVKLNDVSFIEKSMLEAANRASATIINSTFHNFSPIGISGVVVIQESHISIHTWPEHGFAAVDIFTCGEQIDPWKAFEYLSCKLEARYNSSMEITRGNMSLLNYKKYSTPAPSQKTPQEYERNVWYTERAENIALSLRHKGDLILRETSPFQKIEIYDTFEFGKTLVLDGNIMFTENDDFFYHEMTAHVPALVHKNPGNVLILGGGDGGTARELLKHKEIEKITIVEIDKQVVDVCRKYFKGTDKVFNNSKINLVIEDSFHYLNRVNPGDHDIIIIDLLDPIKPEKKQYSSSLYKQISKALSPRGIMISPCESPYFRKEIFKEIYSSQQTVFGKENVYCYLVNIPTYPSGIWGFSFCSKSQVHPVDDLNTEKARIFSQKNDLNYYSELIHSAAFKLPQFVKKLLEPDVI